MFRPRATAPRPGAAGAAMSRPIGACAPASAATPLVHRLRRDNVFALSRTTRPTAASAISSTCCLERSVLPLLEHMPSRCLVGGLPRLGVDLQILDAVSGLAVQPILSFSDVVA